jgi:hypothetical protein
VLFGRPAIFELLPEQIIPDAAAHLARHFAFAIIRGAIREMSRGRGASKPTPFLLRLENLWIGGPSLTPAKPFPPLSASGNEKLTALPTLIATMVSIWPVLSLPTSSGVAS